MIYQFFLRIVFVCFLDLSVYGSNMFLITPLLRCNKFLNKVNDNTQWCQALSLGLPFKVPSTPSLPPLPFENFVPPPPPQSKSVAKEIVFGVKNGKIFNILPTKKLSVTQKFNTDFTSPTENEDYIEVVKNHISGITFFSLLYFYQLFTKLCVLDTEATGLGKHAKITEIGGVILENGERTGLQYRALVNPEQPVKPSAHKLTGYTLKFLSAYSTFKQIESHFLDFIGDSILVFHNARFDLQLLNKALGRSYNLEDKHVIVDTYLWAREAHSDKKKHSLDAFCSYEGVATEHRTHHGALLDAELTAQAFLSMFKRNHSKFSPSIKWNKIPIFDFYKKFQPLTEASSMLFLKRLGIIGSVPESFRYSARLYHPVLGLHFPALLIAFTDPTNKLKGILVRYDFDKAISENRISTTLQNSDQKKHFYGSAANAFVDIYRGGSPKTVFIGDIMNCLAVKSALFGKRQSEIFQHLDLDAGFNIQACLHHSFLPSIELHQDTREVLLLLDYGVDNEKELKNVLASYVDMYCNKSFLSFFNVLNERDNLKDFIFKHKSKDWVIQADNKEGDIRTLMLEMFPNFHSKVVYDEKKKSVIFQGQVIDDPNTHILLAEPKVKIKVVVLKSKSDSNKSIATIAREFPEQIVQRLCGALDLNKRKDIECIENNELARSVYENAMHVTLDSPAAFYMKRRGIEGALPDSFRYLPNAYHPWFKKKLPALLVPLHNDKGALVGINQIFCDYDGNFLPRKQASIDGDIKIPTKLSLGQTVGAAAEVYKATISHKHSANKCERAGVTLISEGTENALIIAKFFELIPQIKPRLANLIYEILGITDTFSVRTCVGINGIMGTPLAPETRTVIILADPDLGKDAKAVMRLTVESFILRNLKVKIVVPNRREFGSLDLNDIFLKTAYKKYEKLAEVLAEVTEITDLGELNSDEESLQDSIERINQTRASSVQKLQKSQLLRQETDLELAYLDTIKSINSFQRR